MARPKKASDEVYNARRRAKRLLNSLQRQIDKGAITGSRLRATRAYMDSIREQINSSYVAKGGSAQQRAQSLDSARAAARELERMTRQPRATRGAQQRANELFARQINLSRLQKPSTLGGTGLTFDERTRYAEAEVNIFYAATRNIWRGKDPNKRNELIMQALGTDNLADAFAQVLSANRDALRAARAEVRGYTPDDAEMDGWTDELAWADVREEDSEQMGSPDYLDYIRVVF